MTRATLLLCAMMAGLPAGAIAQASGTGETIRAEEGDVRGPGGDKLNFTELDTDADGALSEEELDRVDISSADFSSIDADDDSQVSRDEYDQFQRRNQ